VLRELGNEPETEVIKIARASIEAPVTLVDPRAHIADVVLRGWDMIRFPKPSLPQEDVSPRCCSPAMIWKF